MAVLINY